MKLLVLGAGIYQLPVIRKAREMGIETIVLSIAGNYPGIEEASRFVVADTTDIPACLSIAREERVDGVLSTGTDVALPALGAIVDALSLPGPTQEAACCATNKLLMKKAFDRAGVRTAAWSETRNIEETRQAVTELGVPAILKVADSSGSRGIERIDHVDDVMPSFQRCSRNTRIGSMLVEQFLDGIEFGAQAFVASGRLQFVMPHGDVVKRTTAAGVPTGHYVPYPLDAIALQDVQEQTALCVQALGLDNCALNLDFIMANGRVHVLEVGARSGATCLAEIVSAHYGFDYYRYMICHALGQSPSHVFRPRKAVAASILTSEESGTLASIPAIPEADDVIDYNFDYGIGEHVRGFSVGPDRIGHLVVGGSNVERAQERLAELVASLHYDINDDRSHTDQPQP